MHLRSIKLRGFKSFPDPVEVSLEPGVAVVVGPNGAILAGPVREEERTLVVEVDLTDVAAARRFMDPTGHYNRPDVFSLHVDTSPRHATTVTTGRADG